MIKKLLSLEFKKDLTNILTSYYVPIIIFWIIWFLLFKFMVVVKNDFNSNKERISHTASVNRSLLFQSICKERNWEFDTSSPGTDNPILIWNCLRSNWQENLNDVINQIIVIRNKFRIECSKRGGEIKMPEDSNLYRDCVLKNGTKISKELYDKIVGN